MFAIQNFTIGKLLLYERAYAGLITRFVRQTYTVFTWCHMLLGVCMWAKKTIIRTRILNCIIVKWSSFDRCTISNTKLKRLQILVRPIKCTGRVLRTHLRCTKLRLNMSKLSGPEKEKKLAQPYSVICSHGICLTWSTDLQSTLNRLETSKYVNLMNHHPTKRSFEHRCE